MFDNRIIFFYLFALLLAFPTFGQELNRLDHFGTEDVQKSDFLVHLFITENCSVCNKQIEILKKCIAQDKIAAYIEGPSEEKLRNYLMRKKIPFKTFHLTGSAKSKLGFGNGSPSLSFQSEGKFQNIVGLQECPKIISSIKSDNSTLHK